MESQLGEFFDGFSKDLRTEVEKGQDATDNDLILYQQAVSYATAERESIEKRNEILIRKLILSEPSFAQLLLKKEAMEKSLEKQIQASANNIGTLIYESNEIYRSKKGEDLFKATNETAKGLRTISEPVKEQTSYGQFIDALYKIIYEGSASGNRIGQPLPDIVKDINVLRTDLYHDIDHGKRSKVRSKELSVAKIIKRYSGKSSIALLGKEDFLAMQLGILKDLEDYLATLKTTL